MKKIERWLSVAIWGSFALGVVFGGASLIGVVALSSGNRDTAIPFLLLAAYSLGSMIFSTPTESK